MTTTLTNDKLLEATTKVIAKVNKELESDNSGNCIVWFQFLMPLDSSFKEISRPFIFDTKKITLEECNKFLVRFIIDEGKKFRSLYFQKYIEPYKYDKITRSNKKGPKTIIEQDYFFVDENESFLFDNSTLNSTLRESLGDKNNLKDYWTHWLNSIKDETNNSASTMWSYIIIRNIIGYKDDFISSSYAMFSANIIKPETKSLINKYFQDFLIEISFNVINKDLIIKGTKAAISDIINRNMAHHIISHVSHRATLDKVLERIEMKPGFLFMNETFSNDDEKERKRLRNYETVLDLLNRFNQYRDERGEYLTYITSFSSPSSAYFFKDVIRPFIENTLLIDNIAANENINYEKDDSGNLTNNKLKIKVKWNHNGIPKDFYAYYLDKENKRLYCTETLPYLRLKNDTLEYPYDKIEFNDNQKDIEVSLPGTLGKHALYSILENFIRNSAKHGGTQKKAGLDIILFLNEREDAIDVTLTDSCSFVTEEKIKEFNDSIQTEILKRKDLGLIDMKVNACLLAGMELNDDNCKKELIAELHEGKLAYKFKIAKPKKAVFIGDFAKGKSHNKGFFYFETIEDYSKDKNSKSFEFAILSNELYETRYPIAHELPARVLKYSEIESSKVENIEHLYKAWLKKLRGDKKANVHLFFEQNEKTTPTEEFKTKYADTPNLKVYSNEDLRTSLSIEDEKNIFFDRHGGLISKFSKEKSFVDTNHSWILIDKNNSDFDYISRYDIENKTNLLAYELEEAGLLKVLVIDERVAEQSVRSLSHDTEGCKLESGNRNDFFKLKVRNGDSYDLTLFDIAWAANVFIATHLNGKALKQEISLEFEHKLDVKFDNGKISFETNILSCQEGAKFENNNWTKDSKQMNVNCIRIHIKPDTIIIHRTKLKELITLYEKQKKDFVKELLTENEGINLVVTTGSGTTHGIEGDYKILPFATLSKFILGKRINKLQFSKTLLELTNNKI